MQRFLLAPFDLFSDICSVVIFTIPTIFLVQYHESIGISGLHYISFGIGLMAAAQINSRMLDKLYKVLSARNGGVGKPEYRLRGLISARHGILWLTALFSHSIPWHPYVAHWSAALWMGCPGSFAVDRT